MSPKAPPAYRASAGPGKATIIHDLSNPRKDKVTSNDEAQERFIRGEIHHLYRNVYVIAEKD